MKPLSDTFDVESIFTSRFNLEFQRYLQTKDPAKTCSRLEWWDSHKTEFPLLANCARHILAIPASSATSERFFSAGGLMVSSKRTNLAEDTVEDLLMIKLNLEKVENLERMEARGNYARWMRSWTLRGEWKFSTRRQGWCSTLIRTNYFYYFYQEINTCIYTHVSLI